MARRPNRPAREPLVDQWFHFLFTPRNLVRIIGTVILISLARDAYLHPDDAINFAITMGTLAGVFYAIWYFLIRPFMPKKKKGNGGH